MVAQEVAQIRAEQSRAAQGCSVLPRKKGLDLEQVLGSGPPPALCLPTPKNASCPLSPSENETGHCNLSCARPTLAELSSSQSVADMLTSLDL